MKYYILLDNFNRVLDYKKHEEDTEFINENKNYIKVEIEDIKKIIIGETGYINNEFIYVGQTDEEKKYNIINEKYEKVKILKNSLNETDYKIIKCYEASMRQLPLPYNLEELAAQRDAWREEINQLEAELETL